MRISDWSSDVCSSDLLSQGGEFGFLLFTQAADALLVAPAAASLFSAVVTLSMMTTPFLMLFARGLEFSPGSDADRTSVVSGNSVSVRLDLGGSRFIKKNTFNTKQSKDKRLHII